MNCLFMKMNHFLLVDVAVHERGWHKAVRGLFSPLPLLSGH